MSGSILNRDEMGKAPTAPSSFPQTAPPSAGLNDREASFPLHYSGEMHVSEGREYLGLASSNASYQEDDLLEGLLYSHTLFSSSLLEASEEDYRSQKLNFPLPEASNGFPEERKPSLTLEKCTVPETTCLLKHDRKGIDPAVRPFDIRDSQRDVCRGVSGVLIPQGGCGREMKDQDIQQPPAKRQRIVQEHRSGEPSKVTQEIRATTSASPNLSNRYKDKQWHSHSGDSIWKGEGFRPCWGTNNEHRPTTM
eukprot:scaffold14290_cov179-Ochromonas_danica.AAC.1